MGFHWKRSLFSLPSQRSYVILVNSNFNAIALIFTARKRSLGQGNIFTPVCHSVHRGGHAWFYSGGYAWFYSGGVHGLIWGEGGMHGFIRGGMCGFIWGCMVLFGGCVWFYAGGHVWFYLGGMDGFIQGACMVLFRGHAWFYSGGMHGFIRGACMVLFGGACVVFSVFSDTMRYSQ